MGRPQVSVVKRQREQARRERQAEKAAKRAQRKNEPGAGGPPIDDVVVKEGYEPQDK